MPAFNPRVFRRGGVGVVYRARDKELDEVLAIKLLAGPSSSDPMEIERFKRDGCDAVVLGCTEIPLIIDDANSALPTLDSTRLLARAALRRAVATKD